MKEQIGILVKSKSSYYSGPDEQNLFEHYEVQLNMWNAGQQAEDIMRPKEILVYTKRKRIGREDEGERNVREDEQKDEQNDERY